jgi:hypothetical protein
MYSIKTSKDSFSIKVGLPKGLETNYNKTIFHRNYLIAVAEVVTENRRWFDRLLGQQKNIALLLCLQL